MNGLWAEFPLKYAGRKTEWQREFFPGLTGERLKELRGFVKGTYAAQFPTETEYTPMGFVPEHSVHPAMDLAGVKMPGGVDGLVFMSVLHQALRYAEGTWDDGPSGKWTSLKSVFPKSLA